MLIPTVALPAVQTVTDCADFSLTIAPYLPQLRQLPQQVVQYISDADALKTLYLSTNPAVTALAFALFLTPIVLIVSEINRNYSQVDRLWSFLPALYNAHYCLWAHMAGFSTQKLDHVLAVSTLWSIRLTFNYWRKGGYSIGSEDYRWEVLKPILGPTLMFLFNVLFISLAQNLLLFAITTPAYILLLTSQINGNVMTTVDNVFSRLMFFLVLVEFFADQQQWNFQQAKKRYQKTAKPPGSVSREDLDRGFVTSGLWAYSRHPNFAAEQAFWVSLYQWGCFQTEAYANWTFLGAMGYLLLFQASTWFTERITAEKYSDYKVYQKSVGKFLPKWSSLFSEKVSTVNASSKVERQSKSMRS